jgi:hypothetical protein
MDRGVSGHPTLKSLNTVEVVLYVVIKIEKTLSDAG